MLKEVIVGYVLHLPESIRTDDDRVWLMEGGVVDWAAPFIRHAAVGQEHKFKDAPDAQAADPIENGRLRSYKLEWEGKQEPSDPRPDEAVQAEQAVQESAPDGGDDIQTPDDVVDQPPLTTGDTSTEPTVSGYPPDPELEVTEEGEQP